MLMLLGMFQTGKYQEYTEFHSDMLLVKANCLKYNPPEHEIHQVSSIDYYSPVNDQNLNQEHCHSTYDFFLCTMLKWSFLSFN